MPWVLQLVRYRRTQIHVYLTLNSKLLTTCSSVWRTGKLQTLKDKAVSEHLNSHPPRQWCPNKIPEMGSLLALSKGSRRTSDDTSNGYVCIIRFPGKPCPDQQSAFSFFVRRAEPPYSISYPVKSKATPAIVLKYRYWPSTTPTPGLHVFSWKHSNLGLALSLESLFVIFVAATVSSASLSLW